MEKDNIKMRYPGPEEGERPECFGDGSLVCPKDENGVTQPQVECMQCGFLRKCLQSALREQGVIRRPLADTPGVAKITGFFKRWSDRKLSGAG